jgi:hypothetical protein
MPHFDAFGGDEWICQICYQTKDSKTNSVWRKDITENESAGNVCPDCMRTHKNSGLIGQALRRLIGSEKPLTRFQIKCTCGESTFDANVDVDHIQIFCSICKIEFCCLEGSNLYIRFKPEELGVQPF